MGELRPSVENLRSLGMFTQLHRWGLRFEKFPAVLAGAYRSEDINWRAESINTPKLNVPVTKIEVRGNSVNQNGKGEYEDTITLTAIETVNNKIQHFISDWRLHTWEFKNGSTGRSADKDQLEATILITLLTNLDVPRWTYKLIGCLLEIGDPGAELANDPEPQKPILTLRYDYYDEVGVDATGFGADI